MNQGDLYFLIGFVGSYLVVWLLSLLLKGIIIRRIRARWRD